MDGRVVRIVAKPIGRVKMHMMEMHIQTSMPSHLVNLEKLRIQHMVFRLSSFAKLDSVQRRK